MIEAVLSRFMNAFDLKDWALMKSVLADELDIDYGDLRGEPVRTVSATDYVASRENALQSMLTHHLISNFDISLQGDSAEVTASCLIYRKSEDRHFDSHAIYTFRLRKHENAWKITFIAQRILWNEGEAEFHAGVQN